ncbi:MAG: hypothetical protein ACP5UB_06255 [Candidatus Sumerlaeaceae bacterium]|jgi:ABC-type transport system involved in multi-copper enzyme maturation permease subunit
MVSALVKIGWYSVWRSRKSGSPLFFPLLAIAFVAIVWALRFSRHAQSPAQAVEIYRTWSAVFLSFIVPLVSVSFGVGILREQVESKTLVYLWTRPTGRVLPLFIKWLVAAVVFSFFASLAAAILYMGIMLAHSDPKELVASALMLGWDSAALTVGAVVYLLLGLVFSLFGKRGMTLAISYVVLVDFLAALLPGELRKISMKIITLSLSSSGTALSRHRGSLDLLQQQELVSVSEALFTALVVIVLCWITIFALMQIVEIGAERAAGAT